MADWSQISSYDIVETLKKSGVVIVPVGALEQHGPHLPVGTDDIIGWAVAQKVAEALDVMLLPIIPVGFSEDHCPMPGTISLSPDTLKLIIKDIAKNLARDGAKHIIIFSGHGGHLAQISDVCFELNVYGKIGDTRIHNISPWNSIAVETLATVLEEEVFLHAEEFETSLMLFLKPELVNMKKAVKEIPDYVPKGLTTGNFLEAIRIFTTSKFLGRDTKTGICGDATLATKEKGMKIFDILVDGCVNAIRHVTGL